MPLQTINFAALPLTRLNYDSIANALPNMLKGYQIARAPYQIEEEEKKQRLANELAAITNRYEPRRLEAGITQTELANKYYGPTQQAAIEAQRLKNQYYGRETEADIAYKQYLSKTKTENLIQALDREKKKDPNSPNIKYLEAAIENERRNTTFAPSNLGKLNQELDDAIKSGASPEIIQAYKDAISGFGKKTYAPSGIGKIYNEIAEVEAGFSPGSNYSIPISPEQQQEYMDVYKLKLLKESTDTKNRDLVLQGQNLLKSIESSNVDDLVRYSGIAGSGNLALEKAKDLSGNPTEEYLRHLEALQAVNLEAKELRQFFGDSITPVAANAIYEMVNASSITKSPEAAKRMIQKSRQIIKKQVQTRIDALRNTNAYGIKNANNNLSTNEASVISGPQESNEFAKIVSEQGLVTEDNPLGLTKRKKD